ncbi:hypothetical protein AURDEDRAFT_170827 [Auricularia subglabra TFB-10046 SS5]|nr:hypothetical protein AURDEDRAFT_170827 [Auricularia subglabra TFB-10046 SS5]
MIDLKSPVHLANSIHAYILCVHIIFGAYVWEWVTSLDFDFLYIRGKKRWTLAAVSYFLTRYLGLAVWIIGVRICNVFEPINCQNWNYAVSITAYGTAAFTSMLLLLRVAALSSRNLYVVGFLSLFYVSMWGTVIWGMYHSDGVYIPNFHICGAVGIQSHQVNTVMAFAFDGTCLALMMFYLLRARDAHLGSLWSFMLQQARQPDLEPRSSYIPVVVLLYLDLNDAISQTANCFALIIIVVCATRMQRALVLYYEPSSRMNTTARSNTVSAGIDAFGTPRRRTDTLNVTVTVDKYDDDHIEMHKSSAFPGESFQMCVPRFPDY